MAPRPVTAPKPAPKGGAKIAGQPLWLVGLGVLAAIGIGLYFRHRSATHPASAAAPATPLDASSGGAAAGPTPDSTASLADAINGLTGLLGSGSFAVPTSSTTSPGDTAIVSSSAPASSPAAQAPTAPATAQTQPAPYINSANPGTIYTDPFGNAVALQPSGVFQPAYIGPAGSYVSPLTYAGAGVAPNAIAANTVAPPTIPTPPHNAASLVSPAQTLHSEAIAKQAATRATGTHTAGL